MEDEEPKVPDELLVCVGVGVFDMVMLLNMYGGGGDDDDDGDGDVVEHVWWWWWW